MFDEKVNSSLNRMGYDFDEYYLNVYNRFNDEYKFFESLILHFFAERNLNCNHFNNWVSQKGIVVDSEIHSVLFEAFNNIRMFQRGGKFQLFKEREAADGLPNIILRLVDCPEYDQLILKNKTYIYRGMSQAEYDSGYFGQSWTTDYNTAKRFAYHTYSDMQVGIIAQINLDYVSVLYAEELPEYEVILEKNSVLKSNVNIIK